MTTTCYDSPSAANLVRTRARIVLVEDDLEMAQALRFVLEEERYEVRVFADARTALEELRTAERAPDVIVLDLWTPTMNGWQFRLAQKEEPRLARVPVIAISADHSPHAAAIDADRFLPKPLTGTTLLRSLRDVLARAPAASHSAADDNWNALFMALTDLHDARAHAKMLVSELKGFPAARTIALDVLLERAEQCTRHALRAGEPPLASAELAPPSVEALVFQELGAFLAHADRASSSVKPEPAGRAWLELRRPQLRRSVDPLATLAHCLRTLPGLPPELRFELHADGTPLVRAEPLMLQQLLHNVLRNACEAMEGAPEPTLRISTTRHRDAIELRIADSGRGAMVRELERAFDPFFSTKEQHLGLGLTVARRLAVRMEGRLELEREPGGGTVARLVLPAVDKSDLTQQALVVKPSVLLLHHPQRARHLRKLLEDDFNVVCMRPDEAIRHLLGGASYDMVLCALVMPEMTGISFVSALALAQPVQAERLIVLVPSDFGRETGKLLEQLHIWHVEEALPAAELIDSLHGLLRLWRSLRFR